MHLRVHMQGYAMQCTESRHSHEMSILATRLVASQADIGLVRRATRRASAEYPGTRDKSFKVFYLSKRGE